MELIDDGGSLFGAVNVVDALVVLLVLAVVVAGAAFVFMDDPAPEPDVGTTYATLDMGTQPAYIVDAINEGDTYNFNVDGSTDGPTTQKMLDVAKLNNSTESTRSLQINDGEGS
jgi:hypothetical protein